MPRSILLRSLTLFEGLENHHTHPREFEDDPNDRGT